MTELRNRVVQVRRFGDPDGLEVMDAPLPMAGRGEVRVRVLASSLEYTDTLIRRHVYPQIPRSLYGAQQTAAIAAAGQGVMGPPGGRNRARLDRRSA